MKYLKGIYRFRIEEHYVPMNEGYMDQYYTEVDRLTDEGEPWRNVDGITHIESDFFRKNLIPSTYIDRLSNTTCFEAGFGKNQTSGGYVGCNKVYFFQKKKDDWWEVQETICETDDLEMKFYRCDGWEGLVRFLEDKGLVDYSKKIKILEGYIDKFYEEVSRNEYHRTEVTFFSEKEKSNLKSILKDNKDRYKREVEIDDHTIRISGRFPNSFFHLEVFPLEDEWYMGMMFTIKDSDKEIDQHYYKFDQIEGLIQFMKEKNII
jgi:hypothetical protein